MPSTPALVGTRPGGTRDPRNTRDPLVIPLKWATGAWVRRAPTMAHTTEAPRLTPTGASWVPAPTHTTERRRRSTPGDMVPPLTTPPKATQGCGPAPTVGFPSTPVTETTGVGTTVGARGPALWEHREGARRVCRPPAPWTLAPRTSGCRGGCRNQQRPCPSSDHMQIGGIMVTGQAQGVSMGGQSAP